MRARRLIADASNAGLARLAGGTGFGFERAGNQIARLGDNFVNQENYEATEAIKAADKVAAMKEHKAKQNANVDYNKNVNPNVANKLQDETLKYVSLQAPTPKGFKVVNKSLVNLDDGTSKSYAEPKEVKPKQIKFAKPAADGGNDIIYFTDGTQERAKFKSKSDWNKSSVKTSKDAPPAGYVQAGELDINPLISENGDLYFMLSETGAFKTYGNKTYVNKAKYEDIIRLGNTQLK